ncbi:MAG: hypothetical protein KC635_07125 [Myxococcales bacterium]|nr:hypothetical protein [Myxococcales bacterium]MCB9736574.1 hypothetical protein [Deltaproteobacteria bacterium]
MANAIGPVLFWWALGDNHGVFQLTGSGRAARRVVAHLGLAALIAGSAGAARAQEPPDRTVDFYRGPVISSSRIVGLGGAFTGVGEGIDATFRNKAALANRSRTSVDWLDYDLTFDFTITPGQEIDFDGDGRVAGDDVSVNANTFGLSVLFGPFAVGLLAQIISYEASSDTDASAVTADFGDVLIGVGYAFADGELLTGAGVNVRILSETTASQGDDFAELSLTGTTVDMGVLWRPTWLDWRFGANLRFGADVDDRDTKLGNLPEARGFRAAHAPWELGLGASWFLPADPERRYNAPLRSGDGRPSDELEGDLRYLLFAADLVFTGSSPGAVNLEGLVVGEPRAAGGSASVSVHLGAESEVFSNLLRVRMGSYLEPVRVDDAGLYRPHLTGGVEVRLFRLWLWQLKATFAFDVASDYTNLSVGVGFWQ